ncbi:iron export ABC transporter permease subunit FetB [Desulfosarcina widdelii]|uniref:Iron export ABC transporter permease subunit FetB n=1 Tax=Desulfosarcina widdelii TaxID=947919 RepID=A0A5K7Z7S6_9BACT|nr:iron export ABC transporter permease subunit FetB [Desulfosarcina widdelii]BBO75761.1 iron export ABC transporter permease subunit FetB [Desulfosarcina widdelii]
MTTEIVSIGLGQLAIGLVFILLAGLASLHHALRLEKDLLVGTVRTFVQLFLLGYILIFIFKLDKAVFVLFVFGFMIFFAAWEIRSRIKEKQVTFFWPLLVSMAISYIIVSYMVTAVVIGVTPWWKPQYFIPIGGMVIGNSMNAIAIALERLLGELRKRRHEVEAMLSLGADYKEASRDILSNAMRAGMIPSINSMMAVGIVFIPGMMTGQILAGADPLQAVRYQIVVMIMLVGSTAIGSLLVVYLVRKRCFGKGERLLLQPGND